MSILTNNWMCHSTPDRETDPDTILKETAELEEIMEKYRRSTDKTDDSNQGKPLSNRIKLDCTLLMTYIENER